MPDDGWEARMAQRAAERARRADTIEWAAIERRLEAQGWQSVAGMKLGDAVDDLRWLDKNGPIGCACVGPPACCRFAYRQAQALQRGAHIVAKLLADADGQENPT